MAADMAAQFGQTIRLSVCILFLVLGSAASSTPSSNKFDEVVYVHEDRNPPDITTITSSSPSGNASIQIGNLEFGTIDVIDDIIREGIAITSKALGSAKGLVVYEQDGSLYLSVALVFTTPSGTGSLTTQGVVDEYVNGELAITGGTGIFRRARGYVEIVTAVSGDDKSVFQLIIHVDYP